MSSTALHYLPQIEERALDEQLAAWRAAYPEMGLLVLLPEAEKGAVPLVQGVCSRLKVPLAGALFPALVQGNAFRTKGAWLMRFDVMPYLAVYPDLPEQPEQVQGAVDGIANDLIAHLGEARELTLFLLFDAMVPNIATLLDELYLRLANRVHYMGANAGSETFEPMPCLFDAAGVAQRGVLVLLMPSHPGAVLEHCYTASGQALTATSTAGNRILQIDWRPAFEVYQEMARAHYRVEINRDNFYHYAVHFPFGIVRANGATLVRIPVRLEDDGSLFCVGEVPPNSLLTLLSAPAVDSDQTVDSMVEGLVALHAPPAGQELLLFYCAGRRLHLGIDAAEKELRLFAARSKAATIAGALSLGEIGGAAWDYPLFHNATLVASPWGKPER